jgi:hypothetical protein
MKEETHMADLPSYPDSGDDAGAGIDRTSPPGTPRWVKLFGIIALLLVLLFGILHLTGGGLGPDDHGPTIEHGVQQP